MQFLPVNLEILPNLAHAKNVDAGASLTLAEQIAAEGYATESEGETLLPDWTFRFRDFSVDVATELGLFFGSTEAKFKRRLVVYEWQKYRDITRGNEKVRWGVAIRVRMNVRKRSAGASISNILNLAASAHASEVETTVEIDNLGISSATVEAAIPIFSALSMDSFVELQHAFTEALPKLTQGQDIEFTPRILAVWGTSSDPEDLVQEYRSAIATSWALDRIARGRRLREAVRGEDEAFDTIVRDVYDAYAKITPDEPEKRPSEVTKAKARELLEGLEMGD